MHGLIRIHIGPIQADYRNHLDGSTKAGLPSANIVIKGTGIGTQSDENGAFLLINNGDILVASYIGYASQEITIADQNRLDITLLPENQSLDEVVVVGYGTQSRRNITSAISKLDNSTLANAPRANIEVPSRVVSPVYR